MVKIVAGAVLGYVTLAVFLLSQVVSNLIFLIVSLSTAAGSGFGRAIGCLLISHDRIGTSP